MTALPWKKNSPPAAATHGGRTAPAAKPRGAAAAMAPQRTVAMSAARGPDAKTQEEVRRLQATCQRIVDEVAKVIVGKKEVLRLVLVNILSQGNILFEDYPGLAKTVMASTFARASGCDFKRVQ